MIKFQSAGCRFKDVFLPRLAPQTALKRVMLVIRRGGVGVFGSALCCASSY